MRTITLAAAVAASVGALLMATPPASAGPDGIIFDVDFEAPVHTVGSPPAVGPTTLPYDRPSHIWHGDPLIEYGPPGYGQSLNLSNFPGIQSQGDSVSFIMTPFPYANYGVACTFDLSSIRVFGLRPTGLNSPLIVCKRVCRAADCPI